MIVRTLGAALGVVVGVLAGCSSSDGGSDETDLEAAAEACTADPENESPAADDVGSLSDYVSVGDEGKSLTISSPSEGEVASMVSVVVMTCVLEETGASDAIQSQVGQTNSLMGRQDAEWGFAEGGPDKGFRDEAHHQGGHRDPELGSRQHEGRALGDGQRTLRGGVAGGRPGLQPGPVHGHVGELLPASNEAVGRSGVSTTPGVLGVSAVGPSPSGGKV